MVKTKKNKESKQKSESNGSERVVAKAFTCPFCKGSFWCPSGNHMCPHCGKRVDVPEGVQGSIFGFFSKQLEGIACTGGISRIEISYTAPRQSRSATTPVDACEKVISEKPHRERAAEDKNGDFKSQEELQSKQDDD